MTPHPDILDEQERLSRPLIGSIALHVGVVAFLVAFNWWTNRGHIQFGDPNAMGGSIGITPVSSIPLPHRSGVANPVANDTESQVPSEPKKARETKRVAREDPDAIPLHSKRRNRRLQEMVARNQTYRPLNSDRPNQVYSSTGAAVQSPMFGGAAGMGGSGIGNGVFGQRLGWYAQLLQQTIATKWGTESASIPGAVTSSRRVTLTFEILRDGTVRNVRVLESSGNPQVDYAAQRAVLTASPVRRLPEEFERNVANVEFWFQLQR
jgi:periplasmic protein TonB